MTNENAGALRRDITEVERRLWLLLRGRRLEGWKFRRQHPIGPFIVHFACVRHRLIVWLDGGQHADARAAYDARRTACLEGLGWRVMRFWNDEVYSTPEAVIDVIRKALDCHRAS
ncbi:MAG TPA: DUF559 domain-containing protein [Acetobacteraceae bacterium]|nr:DUF559 domain-containing protein [Acetobacteraceae bacterium]